jgi:hypothetical protein
LRSAWPTTLGEVCALVRVGGIEQGGHNLMV